MLEVQSGTLLIDDVLVLLYRERAQKGCCEIRVHDTLTIPPSSCKVVDVEVDLRELTNGEKIDLRVGAVEGLSTQISQDWYWTMGLSRCMVMKFW